MSFSLVGKKIGMSRIFNNKGFFLPVTLINIPFNYIYKKNFLNNYKYFIISFNFKKKLKFNIKINKYLNFNKCKFAWNFVGDFDFIFYSLNQNISINYFYINQRVDVSSFSIGKGFSGVIKRHNFSSGASSHGNSKSHRSCGSTGMNQSPGKVFLGKKMPGRLGNKKITIQNLKILRIDFQYNVIYIKGNIPGFSGSIVSIASSVKKK